MREVEMAMRGRVADGRGWEGGLTIRSASALRFSKGCSSLNLDRMVGGSEGRCVRGREGLYV
jgi:hypothetical protein